MSERTQVPNAVARQSLEAASVAVVGAGPAGLMAVEVLSQAGLQVDVYDGMPSVGRKFLLAGLGGLNLTYSEPFADFVSRYGEQSQAVATWLRDFDADALVAWAHELGIQTFVGSSKRIFPTDMKAAPLLRSWLHRLRQPSKGVPVRFHMRHRWLGWADDSAQATDRKCLGRGVIFSSPNGPVLARPQAMVLALGGGSWSRLGSDGAWVPLLAQAGVEISALRPSNCGFEVQGGWSSFLLDRFAGHPLKSVAIHTQDRLGQAWRRKGECVLSAYGLEGSLVYAASSVFRDAIERDGQARLRLDLLPDLTIEKVVREVTHPRGSRSWSSHLKSRLPLDGVKLALLHECISTQERSDPIALAGAIKALPITLSGPRPLDEAISSAGGVCLPALDTHLMLRKLPGVFCAGEMLDWDAPTGGYLLTACMASGRYAGYGLLRWLQDVNTPEKRGPDAALA